MYQEVTDILLQKGLHPKQRGFYYLRDAIVAVYRCPLSSFKGICEMVGALWGVPGELVHSRMTRAVAQSGLAGGATALIWNIAEDIKTKHSEVV